MKKEILKAIPYSLITETDDTAPLPARTTIEYLQMLYDALPAKVKNHKEVLLQFDNRNEEIAFYYLRELEPGERPDPAPQPVTEAQGPTAVEDDEPPEAAVPRPRPYMRNFDPDYKRPSFDIS